MKTTAVIIGAGPGGAAAAVRLAQRGVRDVVLVDKDRFPRDKTCGSALSPNGLKVAGVRGKDGELRADYVIAADGAHSMFSTDPRPRRTISTLMGWWEGMPFAPGTMEMIFDKQLSPLYGWMFPETDARVNIGICMDGEDKDGRKTERNVRDVFARFLDDHFRDRLRGARQIGKL